MSAVQKYGAHGADLGWCYILGRSKEKDIAVQTRRRSEHIIRAPWHSRRWLYWAREICEGISSSIVGASFADRLYRPHQEHVDEPKQAFALSFNSVHSSFRKSISQEQRHRLLVATLWRFGSLRWWRIWAITTEFENIKQWHVPDRHRTWIYEWLLDTGSGAKYLLKCVNRSKSISTGSRATIQLSDYQMRQ